MSHLTARRSWRVPASLLAAALMASLATGLAQAPEAEAAQFTAVLDDFSGYPDSAALSATYAANSNGGKNEARLVDSPFGDELGKAFRLDYTFASGYTGRFRSVNGYWPGLEEVSLWVQNETPGQDALLQFSGDTVFEVHLNDLDDFDPASASPQHLTIPVAEFKPKSGDAQFDPTRINSFAVYVNQVGTAQTGTLTMDEITLHLSQAPVTPSIEFPDTSLEAAGTSNLISLLRDSAVLPSGVSIVQASYESSNAAVLPQSNGFNPKGQFESNGRTDVDLKQVKLFVDGRTFTVDVNTSLNIAVSGLAPKVDVLEYLRNLAPGENLSAMHHDRSYLAPNADMLHQQVANEFGVYPAIYSADFLTGRTVPQRQSMIDEVKRQWDNGNLVQIMFHVSPPQYTVAEEAQGDWGGDQAHETLPSPNRIFSYLYNDQWSELMTDGSPLNTNWKLRMDEYASYLQQLEDDGVTVMLRPFHEMQQHVFWWGGRPGLEGSAGLYRMFHDYLEDEKGLSNIIWVWNIQDLPTNYGWADGDAKFDRYEGLTGGLAEYNADDWNSFNPGADYYDILSVDFYDPEGYEPRHYQQAQKIAAADGGKPIQIGETFVFPSQEELASQPDWVSVMPWCARTWNYNTREAMATAYQNSLGASDTPRFATLDTSQPRFTDVDRENQFFTEISWLARHGITTGWENADGTREFRPLTPIARDAMAAFLYRQSNSPAYTAPKVSPFSDVSTDNQFYKEIAWLHESGITTGWDNGDGTFSFRPLEPIGRDAMAAFLYRMADSPLFAEPSVSPFTDVTPSTQFYKEITWLVNEGISTGWVGNDGTAEYRPANPINRDAMAAFLYRYDDAGFSDVGGDVD